MTDYSLRTTPLGRMTVRQLPIDDPSVDALPTTTRAILAEIWKRRMTAELHSSSTFAYLVDALTAIDAPPLLIDLARRAIDDERRHGEICGAMSSRYGGTADAIARRASTHRCRRTTEPNPARHRAGLLQRNHRDGLSRTIDAGCRASLTARGDARIAGRRSRSRALGLDDVGGAR